MTIENLSINESEYPLGNGKMGKIAVFLYSGAHNPQKMLNIAVTNYLKDTNTHICELIDVDQNNPWMRVIISNVNDMSQESFDSNKHHIDNNNIDENKSK